MIPVPNLDDRTHKEIVEEALRLIPQYCPEWTNFNPSDPGVTLIELFAWMTEMIIYRLNKVTDKNFVAFLNLMGVRLQPPQPAHALLQFKLVAGGPPTWVDACTPVSTKPQGRDEPVIFETVTDTLVTDNIIARCYTQVSDEYADQTPFIDGRRAEGFEVFGGVDHIERSLYIGDARFEQVGEETLLVIQITSAGTTDVVELLEWEYWNGRRWRELTRSLADYGENTIAFEAIDAVEEAEVDGITSRWIRGRLVEAPPDPHETVLDGISARIEVTGEGLAPQTALVNVDSAVFLTVDMQRSWAPLGREPRLENTLYLLPQTLPDQPGSVIRLDVRLAEARLHDPPQPSEELALSWEYWDGKKWVALGGSTPEGSTSNRDHDFVDNTEAFTQSGEVRFKRPADLQKTEMQGEEGPWLRVRIEAGDYGVPGQYELDGERWIWRDERPLRPPWVQSMTFRYAEQETPVEHVVSYNDFAYFDHSIAARTPLKVFQAFEPSKEDSPALYLGFEKAFPNDPIRVWFQMAQNTAPTADRRHREYLKAHYDEQDRLLAAEQTVVWEYWTGTAWAELSPTDGTRAFTESGFLQFVGPEDHTRVRRFGEALYWIRARLEMGGYHELPRITHVLLNAVQAANHTTIRDEVLGTSDGTPNQTFGFAQGPLLEGQSIMVRERDEPEGEERADILATLGDDAIREARSGGWWVRWSEVDSFYEAGPRGRFFVVDRIRGQIKFGDGRKGMIPPAGTANVVAEHYRVGGGAQGNVTAQAITALRRSIAHIDGAYNPFPAAGGSDQETVEEAKVRGPHLIKSRNRAVTASDYEWLTRQASNGIARAKCLETIGREGDVTVVVVPKLDERRLDLTQKLVPSTELLRRVKHFLDERRLLTTRLHVVRPRYVEVSIEVEVIRTTSGRSEALRRSVEQRLRTFLHPLVGGRDGNGWPFGRNVLKLDLYHVIEGIDGVDVVHRIRLIDEDRRARNDLVGVQGQVDQIKLRPDELVHLVHVEVIEKPREQFARDNR